MENIKKEIIVSLDLFYKCLYTNNNIYIKNEKVIRLSQDNCAIKIITKNNIFTYKENINNKIIHKEYHNENGFIINNFDFLDNIKSNTKFIITITNLGFEFKFNAKNIITDNNSKIIKTNYNKNIDLNFDKTYFKNIVLNLLDKTYDILENKLIINNKIIENNNINKIITEEIEERCKLNFSENIAFFDIINKKIKNIYKVREINLVNEINDVKKSLEISKNCKCNNYEKVIEQYNDEIIFEIKKNYI